MTAPKCQYHTYLQLPALLKLQTPLTDPEHHDEMLFIIIHQCHELGFKQIIHELLRLIEILKNDQIFEAIKTLRRIQEMTKLLSYHMGILNTLSPDEFAGYRHILSPASGFQSYQYRVIEFLCGLKDERFLEVFKETEEIYIWAKNYFDHQTLYDVLITLLNHRKLISKSTCPRSDKELIEALLKVYRERETYSDLHFLFENILDFDNLMQVWRIQHVKIAERTIGSKMGTGGTSGVGYLSHIMSKKLFSELWEVRSLI
jgi:tryptophan 2,3-dioxygenase